eukprot:6205718-Pleurochrysis_carterae.AAC.10
MQEDSREVLSEGKKAISSGRGSGRSSLRGTRPTHAASSPVLRSADRPRLACRVASRRCDIIYKT